MFGSGLPFPSGFLAVDFFFVLSGFVLAYSYEDRFRRGMSFTDFFLVRWIRLYPLYALAMAIMCFSSFGLWLAGDGVRDASLGALLTAIVLQMAFMPAHLPPSMGHGLVYPLNMVAWSLFFELFANLFWRLTFGILTTRVIAGILAFSFLAICQCLVAHGTVDDGGNLWDQFWFGFARVGLAFFSGVLTHRLWVDRGPMPKWLQKIPAWVLVIGSLGIYAIPPTPSYELAMYAFFPAFIYLCASVQSARSIEGLFAVMGGISYPIYILQIPVRNIFMRLVEMATGAPADAFAPWTGMLSLVLLVLVSLALYYMYDIPVRSYLTRLSSRPSASIGIGRTPRVLLAENPVSRSTLKSKQSRQTPAPPAEGT